MIEVENLTKDYGTVVAVSDLSFSVDRGEVVGFLGPNGAGKTTTLRIIAGFLGATSGAVRINGIDILEEPVRARRFLGYMPEASPLYPEMRVREYLEFRARVKRVGRRNVRKLVERAMERAAVTEMAETLVLHLSKGYRQRVGLADALVARPPLLVLDEPTAGLDPNQIREVRHLIRELGESHTVLLSTHILSEVETTCDRAVVIHRGELVAQGTLAELRSGQPEAGAELRLSDPENRAAAVLRGVDGIGRISVDVVGGGTAATIAFETAEDDRDLALERTVEALVRAGVGVREARLTHATLEDVFAQVTQPAGRPEPGADP